MQPDLDVADERFDIASHKLGVDVELVTTGAITFTTATHTLVASAIDTVRELRPDMSSGKR